MHHAVLRVLRAKTVQGRCAYVVCTVLCCATQQEATRRATCNTITPAAYTYTVWHTCYHCYFTSTTSTSASTGDYDTINYMTAHFAQCTLLFTLPSKRALSTLRDTFIIEAGTAQKQSIDHVQYVCSVTHTVASMKCYLNKQ
jgi:hypothetical protein